jgi:DHA2 family multidrug resistance protein
MAVWGMGAILGPIIGPALGGWLTDNLNWRWVFYINLPIGVLAFLGLSAFLEDVGETHRNRLDYLGFFMFALAIGSLQLMLDRGQTKDWFASTEIWVEGGLAVLFFYLFTVHTITARRPFIDRELFADANFMIGSMIGFFMGSILFGVLALLPPMLEGLMGYPVVLTGLVTAPRGLGTMLSMVLVGWLSRRVDPRLLIAAGFLIAAYSLHRMASFSLEMDESMVIWTGFIQGMGTGLVFVPLSIVAFATIPPRFRNEGAAMFSLIRNIGSAIGIALLQAMTIRNTAIVHSRLVEGIRPDNPVLDRVTPGFDFHLPEAVAQMNAAITRQAAMVAYMDSFWLLCILSLAMIPPLLLMRRRSGATTDDIPLHMD